MPKSSEMLIGIEQERFAFKGDTCLSIAELQEVFAELAERFKVEPFRCESGLIRTLEIPTEAGLVTLKTDFATHIWETAFPPVTQLSTFLSAYQGIWSTVAECAVGFGIHLSSDSSILRTLSDCAPFGANSTAENRGRLCVNRSSTGRQFWFADFPARICATHVTLSESSGDWVPIIRELHRLLYLVPLCFTTSPAVFRGGSYASIRPLIWRDTHGTEYWAVGFGRDDFNSHQEYSRALPLIPGFIRDYSFIAPRGASCLEFRVADSQPSAVEIGALALFYMAAIQLARSKAIGWSATKSPEEVFYRVCCDGRAPAEILALHIPQLIEVIEDLPGVPQEVHESLLNRLRAQI